jgi:hypothetical protein
MTVDLSVYGKTNTLADYLRRDEKEAFERDLMQKKLAATIQNAGGSDPAVLKINTAISEALKKGDIETANRLERLAKTTDKGIDFYGGGTPFQYPQTGASNATQPGQFDNLDGILAEMGTPQQGSDKPMPLPNYSVSPQAIPGYGQAVGSIEGAKKRMETQALKDVELSMDPKIARQTEKSKIEAKDTAEAGIDFDQRMARMPQLEDTVKRLSALGKVATYTMTGRARDLLVRELGFDVPDAATARTEYISMVDNEILPLLRETFGAQFTEREGNSLKVTLGDPNKSPQEKDAVLRSFIRTKKETLNTQARKLGYDLPYSETSSNQPAPQQQNNTAPKMGQIVDGYAFMGGDPSQQSSWKKVK